MITINKIIDEKEKQAAIDIFTNAFIDDPLFVFAFPEIGQRKKLTKIMYQFVVFDMVPELNLTFKGAYEDDKLTGSIIYTTPESKPWSDKMMDAVNKMRKKANDKRINLIGEFAMLTKYNPPPEHCYGNELAVM